MVLVSSFMWVIEGFDSTVESTFLGGFAYGYGLHWSTVLTISLFFYILIVNAQTGGLSSFRQFFAEFEKDMETIGLQAVIIVAVLRRRMVYARTLWNNVRNEYSDAPGADGLRGFFFAAALTLSAALLFELIWVPLYDSFNFGNLFWPVYYFGLGPGGSPLLSPIFVRNVFIFGLLLSLGTVMFYLAMDGEKGNLRARFSVKWRFDRYWPFLVMVAGGLWAVWVFVPHQTFNAYSIFNNPASIQSFHGVTQAQLESTKWLMPSQSGFPQTEYTFYNASAYLQTYSSKEIYGFYAPNVLIHSINVLTKFATFAAICYPALVVVKKNAK